VDTKGVQNGSLLDGVMRTVGELAKVQGEKDGGHRVAPPSNGVDGSGAENILPFAVRLAQPTTDLSASRLAPATMATG
jgi:hypothetical protein